MDRRWIRIDRAHRTFDCPPADFDTLLVEARSEDDSSAPNDPTPQSSAFESGEIDADIFQLQEAINTELALLASLQRRERILKTEREQIEHENERIEEGWKLADLHAAMLRHDSEWRP